MKDEIRTGVDNISLRDMSDEGHIRFNIKAPDTEENQRVHDAFKEFCKVETDNNYTVGLRKLLEYYQGDFKYEMILDKIQEQAMVLADVKSSIVELQGKKKEPDQDGLF